MADPRPRSDGPTSALQEEPGFPPVTSHRPVPGGRRVLGLESGSRARPARDAHGPRRDGGFGLLHLGDRSDGQGRSWGQTSCLSDPKSRQEVMIPSPLNTQFCMSFMKSF